MTLTASDEPIADVLKKIAGLTGTEFVIDEKLVGKVSVTIKDMTFWDALLQVLRVSKTATIEFDEKGMRIVPKKFHRRPVRVSGEFVIWMAFSETSATYSFAGDGPRNAFDIELHAAWESHVKPLSVKIELDEVADDQGTDLIIPKRGSYYGNTGSAPKAPHKVFRFSGRLNVPGEKAKKLAVIRGVATFVFPMKYQKLNIELQASNRTHRLGKTSFTLSSVQLSKRGLSCQMDVSTSREFGQSEVDRIGKDSVFIVDDEGKEHPVTMESNSTSRSSSRITRHYTVGGSVPEGRTAKSLRVKALAKSHEKLIRFTFKDLPIR